MDLFKHAVVTGMIMPGAHPTIRRAMIDVEGCVHYARWVLLQLSIEADLTRGCFM